MPVFSTYTYTEIYRKLQRGAFNTQISYAEKGMPEYSEALLHFTSLQFMRKNSGLQICVQTLKKCLMFIFKDKYLVNSDNHTLNL